MESRYDPERAAALCRQYAEHGEHLALRLYTARLIGREPALGRSTALGVSVKTRLDDGLGEEIEVVQVSRRGVDLSRLQPADMVACRLAPLRRSAALPALTDEQLVRQLFSQRVEAAAAGPSLTSILHACIPARFVDYAQPDAILQLLAQPDPEAACRRAFGDDVLFVPYRLPGAALALELSRRLGDYRQARGTDPMLVLLGDRGVVTWGEGAQESYEALVGAVSRVERAVSSRQAPLSAVAQRGTEVEAQRRLLGLAVRGAMQRASGQSWVAVWNESPRLVAFSRRRDVTALCDRGLMHPENIPLAKHRPLVLDSMAGGLAESLRTLLDHEIMAFAARHRTYVERGLAARRVAVGRRDPWPRAVLVEGLGLLGLGATRAAAQTVGAAYEHAVEVVEGAEALGGYRPLDELDAFEREHWNEGPEESPPPPRSLEGRVAVVTGAGSGIGLATSRAMLAAGAHVLITDQDARVLEAVSERPRLDHGERVAWMECRVTSDEECAAVVERACELFGGVDILVSNASTAPSGGLHTASGDAALRASLDVNLMAHQRVARAAAEVMVAQGSGGVLLFNASRIAFSPGPDFGPYAVPKAALVALMRQYAVDLGAHGIRANAVNADRVRIKAYAAGITGISAGSAALSPSQYFRTNLLERETTADDVAEAFVYLASAGATTGCVITVDGGNPAAFPR